MNGNLVLDYIRATTNLYGIAPFEKIMEIYNQQNDDQICIEDLDAYIEQDLSEYYVYVYYENFVHETILEFDEFDLVQAEYFALTDPLFRSQLSHPIALDWATLSEGVSHHRVVAPISLFQAVAFSHRNLAVNHYGVRIVDDPIQNSIG